MDLVFKYGKSGTSFLTLYSGFKYFRMKIGELEGLIAYIDTPTAWVGASDPSCPAEIQLDLLRAFFAAAKKARGAGLILPVSKELARLAREQGFYALQVGSEPWFSLDNSSNYTFDIAKRLLSKGATVERFNPIQLSLREYRELDLISKSWLESRGSVPLSFLNRVEPWLYFQHKRYYRVSFQRRTVGFLVAVPVIAKNSWYLVDLIRLANAPVGATELLISTAIEELKAEGAAEVTLGMSPLARVGVDEFKFHPLTYRILRKVYHRSNSLYSFQSLFEYKEKLKPSHWVPLYLIADPTLNLRAGYGLFRAIFSGGIFLTSAKIALKKARRYDLEHVFERTLSMQIVPRSTPRSMSELLYRSKTVLSLAVAQLLFFFIATDPAATKIRPNMESRYGYSLERFLSTGINVENLKALVLSSFLHENRIHLVFNLVTLIFLAGFLEIVAGSTAVGACYLLGILFSNPLTSLFLYPIVEISSPGFLDSFTQSVDVGCSLGVFACIGALTHFTRKTKESFLVITVLIFGAAAVDIKLLDLNHIAAMGIGLLFVQYYAPKTEISRFARRRV